MGSSIAALTLCVAPHSKGVGHVPEFTQEDGGVHGRDRGGNRTDEVYFVGACASGAAARGGAGGGSWRVLTVAPTFGTGIIDILQQYNTFKRAETLFKGIRVRPTASVPPACSHLSDSSSPARPERDLVRVSQVLRYALRPLLRGQHGLSGNQASTAGRWPGGAQASPAAGRGGPVHGKFAGASRVCGLCSRHVAMGLLCGLA